jgi:hypothetical protein
MLTGVSGLEMPPYPQVAKQVMNHMLQRSGNDTKTESGHNNTHFGVDTRLPSTCILNTKDDPSAAWASMRSLTAVGQLR